MSKILVLQHHPGETLGVISEALQSAALAWQYVRGYEGQPVPANLKGAEGLIVMGGPQIDEVDSAFGGCSVRPETGVLWNRGGEDGAESRGPRSGRR